MEQFQRNIVWYLHHGASATRADGYMPIQKMLKALAEEIAEADVKGRFPVVEEDGTLLIRANQGVYDL